MAGKRGLDLGIQASGTGSVGFTAEQALGVASTHSKLQSTPSAPGSKKPKGRWHSQLKVDAVDVSRIM